jgi:hypothetical protein
MTIPADHLKSASGESAHIAITGADRRRSKQQRRRPIKAQSTKTRRKSAEDILDRPITTRFP